MGKLRQLLRHSKCRPIVNYPYASPNSQFEVEVFSPLASCSSTNPYESYFAIGYTSDFSSSGYLVRQNLTTNAQGKVVSAWLTLINYNTNTVVDRWQINLPTACQVTLYDDQLIIVGWATVSYGGQNHVQNLCMTGGNGTLSYWGSNEYYQSGYSAESSNVVYTQAGTNQQTFAKGAKIPSC